MGVTSNLTQKVDQHQQNFTDGFTKKYNRNVFVYDEEYNSNHKSTTRGFISKIWRIRFRIKPGLTGNFYLSTPKYLSSYLGQNFLTDQTVLDHIADQVEQLLVSTESQTLVEIGPGKGALTERIQDLSKHTLLIEYDSQMVNYLNEHNIPSAHTHIITKDVLQREEGNKADFPFQTPQDKTLIVGNLPYYITSPILRKFFETQTPTRAGGVFLIQREAAEKIIHNAPKKSFLRWLINYAYKVEHCFDVAPTAFTPAPKVVSSVIRVSPKALSKIPNLNYQKLLQFLDLYSPYKRKTLGASHKIVTKHQSKKKNPDAITFNISAFSHHRLEELGWEEMKKILSIK